MSKPEPLFPSLTCVPAAGRHMAASSECALCAGAGLSGEDQATLYTQLLQGPTPTPTLCSLQVDCSEAAVSSVVSGDDTMTAAPWLPGPPSTSAARDGAGPGLTEPRVRDTEVGETPPPPPQPPHSTVCTVCHRSHFMYSTDTPLNKYPLLQNTFFYTLYQTL